MSVILSSRPVRYVVISPVRNEAEHLETTIQSVTQQTVRALRWLIVDDGSTDETSAILERYALKHPWITPVQRSHVDRGSSAGMQETKGSRGKRARDAKEIEAFYVGYEKLVDSDWEYLVKLDGDLSFEPDYFEKCFAEFEADPKLGIGGGTICHLVNGQLEAELTPKFHVRGATKIYRRACWQQIGGVIRGASWDTLDEVKANMLGWSTRTFPHLKVAHLRVTGAANGAWQNAVKNGVWSYIAGYHPLFMLARCGRQAKEKPHLLGSAGLLYGYIQAYIQGIPRAEEKMVRYMRSQQIRKLSFRPTIWK
jgi:glycosyltransferase involved in cell wall biosynthesis